MEAPEPEFVRSPHQSADVEAAFPAPPPILDAEVLDENLIRDRVTRSKEYLRSLKRDDLHRSKYGDIKAAKRYKAEVKAAAIAHPLMRIVPRVNVDQVADLNMPHLDLLRDEMRLTRQQIQNLRRETRQQARDLRREVRQQTRDLRRETRQQFRDVHLQINVVLFNMGAVAYNSQALLSQLSIRALKNAGDLPDPFPATRGEFQGLEEAAARDLLGFYGIRRPRGGNAKMLLAEHVGLREIL